MLRNDVLPKQIIEIDPTAMSELEQRLFWHLMENIHLKHTQKKDDQPEENIYLVENGEYVITVPDENNSTYRIKLKNYGVVYRECNSDNKQYRCEVIKEVGEENEEYFLGEGGFGKVLKLVGLLTPKKNKVSYQTYAKRENGSDGKSPRVIKIEVLKNEDDINEFIKKVKTFNDNLNSKYKKPLITTINKNGETQTIGLTVMPQAKGNDLCELLDIELENLNKKNELLLSTEKRIDLILAILYAIQEEVHDKQLAHLDLQPGNLKVYYDPSFKKFFVKVIDWDRCIKIQNEIENIKIGFFGTPGYIPFERFSLEVDEITMPCKYLYATDFNATAFIIAELLLMETPAKKLNNRDLKFAYAYKFAEMETNFLELFKSSKLLGFLSQTEQGYFVPLVNHLTNMVKLDPNERANLKPLINECEIIKLKIKLKKFRSKMNIKIITNNKIDEIKNKIITFKQEINDLKTNITKKATVLKNFPKIPDTEQDRDRISKTLKELEEQLTEKNNELNQLNIVLAFKTAWSAKSELITHTQNNKLTCDIKKEALSEIKDKIALYLDPIADDPIPIEEFVETLRIKALMNLKNKEEILAELDKMLTLPGNIKKLEEIRKKAAGMGEDKQEIVTNIDEIFSRINQFSFTVDSILEYNQKLEKRIKRFEPQVTTRVEEILDPIVSNETIQEEASVEIEPQVTTQVEEIPHPIIPVEPQATTKVEEIPGPTITDQSKQKQISDEIEPQATTKVEEIPDPQEKDPVVNAASNQPPLVTPPAIANQAEAGKDNQFPFVMVGVILGVNALLLGMAIATGGLGLPFAVGAFVLGAVHLSTTAAISGLTGFALLSGSAAAVGAAFGAIAKTISNGIGKLFKRENQKPNSVDNTANDKQEVAVEKPNIRSKANIKETPSQNSVPNVKFVYVSPGFVGSLYYVPPIKQSQKKEADPSLTPQDLIRSSLRSK